LEPVSFLPAWPIALPDLAKFCVALIVAMLVGEWAERAVRLPRIAGYVITGLVLSQFAGLINDPSLRLVSTLVDTAIGMILFELGQRVSFGWIKRNPWLLATSLLESGLAFGAVFVVLILLDMRAPLAAILAAVSMATSPAVVMTVARDLRAQGQVTERLMLLTALNNIYAVFTVSMLFAWLHLEYRHDAYTIYLHPVYLLAGSIVLAGAAAYLLLSLLEYLDKRRGTQVLCVITLVIVATMLAEALKFSPALTALAFGAFSRSMDRKRHFASLDFGDAGLIIIVAFFVLTGSMLDVRFSVTALLAALGLVAARGFAKLVGIIVLGRPSGIRVRKSSLVAIGMLPMSGLALLLARDALALYPHIGRDAAGILPAAVLILEIIGPLAVTYVLKTSGEAGEEGHHGRP
jgi:Kef-type K+ transport system membrane component KefB